MPHSNRPTSVLTVLLVAVLALAVVGVSAAVIASSPDGGFAAATNRPSADAGTVVSRATPAPTGTPEASPSPRQGGSPAPLVSPSPMPSATPTPKPVLAMNLYRAGDFVSQATKEQCVSAAMQIMLNIVGPTADRSKRTQAGLAALAMRLSEARKGATEPRGWARGLAERGAGHYEVMVARTLGAAVEVAVRALRARGRPVGMLVWRGAHSWVLHGFETTADPASGQPFGVTHLYVSDPWYPRISSIWGPSRGPNARITPKQLAEDYLPWKRPSGRYPGMDGRFVLIVPVNG